MYETSVTHSPINFGRRNIDHNVLFCSLVFLPAAFDSIRGCGESIYLPRCHAPLVMDGGCTLTLTQKEEVVPRTSACPRSFSLSHSYSFPRTSSLLIPKLDLHFFFFLFRSTSSLTNVSLTSRNFPAASVTQTRSSCFTINSSIV